jgi:hypothetical protein
MNNNEQKIANVIAKSIVIVLVVFFSFCRAIARLLNKLKRWLFRLAIVIFIFYNAFSVLHLVAYAPYANASEFQYTQKPVTEHQMIVNEIYTVFGKDAPDAFKVLSCENHALNPNAQNYNNNGTVDIGIMQINSVHNVPGKYLYDWRTNISVGYQIFKDSGWGAWTCSYMLK